MKNEENGGENGWVAHGFEGRREHVQKTHERGRR